MAGLVFLSVVTTWLVLSVAVGVLANSKGRTGFGWAILAMLLSPLIAGLVVAILPKTGKAALPRDEVGNTITDKTHRRCPDCREIVRRDARKCKHCGAALVPQ